MKSSSGGRIKQLKKRLFCEVTKGCRAICTRADAAKVLITEDAGIVAIVEIDLHGVVADLGGGLGANFGFEHGQHRRGDGSGFGARATVLLFLIALVVARGAGTFFAEIRKIVMADVIVGPGDIHARAAGYVNFNG